MGKFSTLDDSIKKILQIKELRSSSKNRLLVLDWIKEKHRDNTIEEAAGLVIEALQRIKAPQRPKNIGQFTKEDIGKTVLIRPMYLGLVSEPSTAIRGMDSTGFVLVSITKKEMKKFLNDEPTLGQEMDVRGILHTVDKWKSGMVLNLQELSILEDIEPYIESHIEQILKTKVKPWFLTIETKRGELVRSKAECLIADTLYSLDVDYEYEKPLKGGSSQIHPDFTLKINGLEIFWEHAGPLDGPNIRPSSGSYGGYYDSHEWKMNWYKENHYEGRVKVTYGSINESDIKETLCDLEKMVESFIDSHRVFPAEKE